jgi:hypothetical protein
MLGRSDRIIKRVDDSNIMRLSAFTVDVDRDVNQACHGKICAVSAPKDGNDSPRFDSSAAGLEIIVDVLNDLDIQGTFFFEARTALEIAGRVDLVSLMRGHEVACHSYDHEDLTGERTGVLIGPGELDDIIERSISALREIFGVGRLGFRAPYLSSNDALQDMLRRKDFLYDSSVVQTIQGGTIGPYVASSGLMQVPIASGIDRNGKKIVGYLWPMHEGMRVVNDYLALYDDFNDGLFVLATHSWHLVENFAKGPLGKADVDIQTDNLHELLSKATDGGVEFVRIDDHLEDHPIGGRR